MCGIFGMASTRLGPVPIQDLTDTLTHRGPDDFGCYVDEFVALGHRRLSIIDLGGGHQPVFNEDRTKCIVFNGEIYNFPELRKKLIGAGHRFATKTDTETIVHAYEEWGEQCVNHLRGMFAFALWDLREKKLFIARDRIGIKPLFYAEHEGALCFGSEMKAILALKGFPREMDEAAVASFFLLSYIPAPLTIFSKIRKLLPGHTLTWQDDRIRINRYWDLHIIPDRERSEPEFIADFMALLEESVKSHLISDVPVGAFLSGGIDSSAVVALMSRSAPSRVNSLCIGFGGNTGNHLDERKYADEVARRYSTHHTEYEVTPALDGLIDKIVQAFDEPFADDSSIPSYYVCKMARENVTVALSGLGGDELFGGYERYLGFNLQGYYSKIPRFLREKLISKIVDGLPERAEGPHTVNHLKRFIRAGALPPDQCYMGYLSILDQSLQKSLFADSNRFNRHQDACRDLILGYFNSPNVRGPQNSLDRALYCDIKTYLPDDILTLTDRISMQHSLEVRVPFIDHELLEYCVNIPHEMKIRGTRKKYLLKKAFSELLPADVLHHRKQGFVGPTSRWLKTDLKPFVLSTLSDKNLARHGLFNQTTVRRILHDHFSGKETHDKIIWSLVVFQKWHDLYC